jgi:hypothetical protein
MSGPRPGCACTAAHGTQAEGGNHVKWAQQIVGWSRKYSTGRAHKEARSTAWLCMHCSTTHTGTGRAAHDTQAQAEEHAKGAHQDIGWSREYSRGRAHQKVRSTAWLCMHCSTPHTGTGK